MMRVPLPITAFLIVIALWGGTVLGKRGIASSPADWKNAPVTSQVGPSQSGPSQSGRSEPQSEQIESQPVIAPENDSIAGLDVATTNGRFWLGVLAITAVGLTVMMLTSGGAIPPRMDHTVADILHSLPQGVCILDDSGKILMANIAAARLMGESPNRILGRRLSALPWLGHRELQSSDPWNQAASTPVPTAAQWMRYQCGDGPIRTFSVGAVACAHPPDPRTFRTSSHRPNIVVTLQDVTDLERRADDRDKMVALLKQDGVQVRRQNRRLQQLASTDPLTGCLNRRQFFAQFEKIWQSDAGARDAVTVLMIDNDKFKNLNDTYGHGVGDEVLKKVSAWLKQALPQPAMVCRYGGEEFCALLPDCQHDTGIEIAEALRKGVTQIRVDDQPELRVSVSIGVATSTESDQSTRLTPVQLIAKADRRLYEAKNGGRNRVVGKSIDQDTGDETVIEWPASDV